VPLVLLIMPLLGVVFLLGAASQEYIRARSS
jgi:hypothetical protein